MIRKQYPLKLAYCLSYNRSQGQSADAIIMDIVNPPFAHGHFYVGSSRVRWYSGLIIYCHHDQARYNDNGSEVIGVVVPNVVHKEVLILPTPSTTVPSSTTDVTIATTAIVDLSLTTLPQISLLRATSVMSTSTAHSSAASTASP